MVQKLLVALLAGAVALSGCAVSTKTVRDTPATPVLLSKADVAVSDGSAFKITTGLSPKGALYTAEYPDRVVRYTTDMEEAVSHDEDGEHALPDDYVLFVLAHQFHAQVPNFTKLNDGVWMERDCAVEETPCTERIGRRSAKGLGVDYLALRFNPLTLRPYSLIAYRRKQPPIVATFDDWRKVGGLDVAYRVMLDDGERVFDYRFTSIEGL